jgi:leader peptidase (prepilin peptidase)/N-methyltransferase
MTGAAGSSEPALHQRNRLFAAAAGAAGAGVSFLVLPMPPAAFAAVLAALAAAIVVTDLERRIIPDIANAALLAAGLAFVWSEAVDALPALGEALLRAAAAGAFLYALRFAYLRMTGVTGLGLGDVKLAAAGAPFLAWATLPLALALAALAAILAVIAETLLRRAAFDRRMEVPFGAFLAPAIWLALMFERTGVFQG